MHTNRISVITAAYNAVDDLPTLIESLRQQSDSDFEWVVADGGSSDGTVELLNSINDLDINLSSQADFGIYDAINRAIEISSGEYYIILGADDRLYPNAIADYKKAITGFPDIVTAKVDTDFGELLPTCGSPSIHGHLAFVSQHSVGTLIKKKLHANFGLYSRRFPIAADQYFLKKVCADNGTAIRKANFSAGFYSTSGVSGTDVLGTMTEFFRVQIETERNKVFQLTLFILRIVIHSPKIIRYFKK